MSVLVLLYYACCVSCNVQYVSADPFLGPPMFERSDCPVKVAGALKDTVVGYGRSLTLDNICNNVFLRSNVASTFGCILKTSWEHQRAPCLLLFAQAIVVSVGWSGVLSSFAPFEL